MADDYDIDEDSEQQAYYDAINQIQEPQGLRNPESFDDAMLNHVFSGSSTTLTPRTANSNQPLSPPVSSTRQPSNTGLNSYGLPTSNTVFPAPPSQPPSQPSSRSASRASRAAAASAAAAAAVMSISPHHQSHPQHQQHQQELMLEPDSATTEQTDEDMNKYEDVGGTVIAFNGKRRDGEHGTGATLVELKKMRGADGKMKIAIGETDQAALQKQKEMQRTPRSPRIQPIMTGRDDDEPDYAHLIQELESRERAAEQRIQMQQRKMDARAQELAALEQRLQEEDQNLQRFQQSLQQQQRQFQQQQKQFQKEQLQQHQQHQQQQHTLTSDEYRELLELRQQRHAYQNANHANTPSSISRDRYERLARENQKLTLDLKQVNRQVDNAIRHAQLQLNSPRVSTSPTKTPRLQLPTVRSGASPMSARSMGPSPRSGPSPRGVAAPSPRIAGLQGERGLTARGGGDGEGAVYTREDMATKNAEISTLNRHMEWANRELQQLREKVASQPVQRIIELENTLVERDRTIKALQKDIRMMNRVIDDHNKKAFHDEFIGAPVARIEAESKHLKERLKIAEHKVSEQERIIWNQNRLIGEFHIKDVPVSPQ